LQKSPLFEFDLEIERTFHKLKRQRALLIESASEMAGGEEAQRRTLRDYVTSGVHSQTPGITIPPVKEKMRPYMRRGSGSKTF